MKPALVILAAGIGRRFGGTKQLEPVGPGGATIMDYSIYDALRAGFGQIVFVIRREMEAVVRESLGRRYAQRVPVAYAFQRLDDLPAGFAPPLRRVKPWGTGQAVLAAASVVEGPLAVINADDSYGANSFEALGAFLRAPAVEVLPTGAQHTFALVGYRLGDTLSERGAVARAVCRCDADGWLQDIVETAEISKAGANGQCTDPAGQTHLLPGDTLVSMNLWGFTPAIFDELRAGFAEFLRGQARSPEAEFPLPGVIQQGIAAGRVRVRVLPTTDSWCGVTHPRDLPRVREFLRALVARGVYPEEVWR